MKWYLGWGTFGLATSALLSCGGEGNSAAVDSSAIRNAQPGEGGEASSAGESGGTSMPDDSPGDTGTTPAMNAPDTEDNAASGEGNQAPSVFDGSGDDARPGAEGGVGEGFSPSPESCAAVLQVLEEALQRGDAPGMVALVTDERGVLCEGSVGALNAAAGTPMPIDAIFNLASMTKPVTSVAVMMLAERGLLDIDDPVSDHLPDFDVPEVLTSFDAASGSFESAPAETTMTLRHLLSHTSGIGYTFSNATVASLSQSTQLSETQLPLLHEPGAEWHYGASTRLLGNIVTQLSGQSLEQFFQEEIFAPLGMVDTSYAVPGNKQARVPTQNTRQGAALSESPQNGVPTTPPAQPAGDGGLYGTARDYGRFMQMFLRGGELDGVRILSEASITAMGQNQIGDIFVEQQDAAIPFLTRPFPLGAGTDKFGLGFQITGADSDDGIHRSAGSMAWAGLFNTEFWIDPAQGVAATLLMQVLPFYDEGAITTLQDFEAAVYRELSPR